MRHNKIVQTVYPIAMYAQMGRFVLNALVDTFGITLHKAVLLKMGIAL